MSQGHRVIHSRFVMRSLFQVKGIWYCRVRDTRTGKIQKISTRERNKRKAEQVILDLLEGQLKRDMEGQITPVRFEDAFREWIDLKAVRPSTRGDYESSLNVYRPAFGNALLDEIAPKDLERFLKGLDVKRRSTRTRQYHLTLLRSFFRWAIRHGHCPRDPTDGIKVPRGARRKGAALTCQEACRLLHACRESIVKQVQDHRRKKWEQEFPPPSHLFFAVLISLHTGLRRGNVTGLLWREVDLGKMKITIPAERMKANADHEVPIHPELAEVFQGLLREREKVDPDEPVIGKAIREIKKSFKSALKRANLPDIRWHDLRHTFATWVGQRATFVVYRALLGHSPGSVSERYFHPPFEELKRVIDSMPRLLTGVQDKTQPAPGAAGH